MPSDKVLITVNLSIAYYNAVSNGEAENPNLEKQIKNIEDSMSPDDNADYIIHFFAHMIDTTPEELVTDSEFQGMNKIQIAEKINLSLEKNSKAIDSLNTTLKKIKKDLEGERQEMKNAENLYKLSEAPPTNSVH